jgi:glycosyltransferase involved in cell wall biosynthesis
MISVIIPSYNRYNNLLNAISSVKNQTYKDYEIIVVSDGSTDKRYLQEIEKVKIIRLSKSSKLKLGYPCGAIPRNEGIKQAKGEYICFLDDDDIWMPNKLEIQIAEMKKNNIDVSCSEGYIGYKFYNKNKKYKLYNKEYYFNKLKKKYNISSFPKTFNLSFLQKHNFIITSSICIKKSLIDKVGYMKLIKNGGKYINGKKEWQDWDYWKRILKFTDCLYIDIPLFYYDLQKY